MKILSQMNEAVAYLQSQVDVKPQVGIILGTGLGGLADKIKVHKKVPYEDIPHFPVSTVKGHSGQLVFGELGGKQVMAMQGRFHYYEGYTLQEVTFPVRVMKLMGIERLIVSNASGGVNPDFEIGEIMLITDHINFFPGNPLIGKNIDELGPRFPDMSDVYCTEMLELAEKIAAEKNIRVAKGVYLGLTGPTLETPAEYKMVRILGADTVGMSTVPEVIVANHCGIKTVGISCLTNMAAGILDQPLNHEEVIETSAKVKNDFIKLMNRVIEVI